MARKKNKVVLIRADQDFFDRIFEPARKRTQKELGLQSLSQPIFTSLMNQKNIKLDIKLKGVDINDIIKIKKTRKKR